jgi:two-component system sensor histidine kinase KdpD
LGIAPGVGKTYAMLRGGHNEAASGRDVVIGHLEDKGRSDTVAQGAALERVEARAVPYRGAVFAEMDTEAVLRRQPELVLVDELAHQNLPGSPRSTRWEDVAVLLEAGLDVHTTINVGNIASLGPVVDRVTNTRPGELVPDELLATGEIHLIDLPPDALRRRLAAGSVVAPEQVSASLGSYFRYANLAALRELAQLWVNNDVSDAASAFAAVHAELFPETRQRIVVGLSGAASDEVLAALALEVARIDGSRVVGVHVRDSGRQRPGSVELAAAEAMIAAADGEVFEVVDDDLGGALIRAARRVDALQLIIGSSRGSRWNHLSQGSTVRRVLRLAGELPVQVVPLD